MRHVWLAALFVLWACAGGAVESITTTSVDITTSVSSTSASTTSTTVPPVTPTTLDVMLIRAAGWLFVKQMVRDLFLVDNPMVSEGAMNNYIDSAEEIIAAIDDVEIGLGWGDCADAVNTMREAMVFAIEGVTVGTSAFASSDEGGIEDAGEMLTLALEKLTEAVLLGDVRCQR